MAKKEPRRVEGGKYEKNEQNGEIFNRYRENNRENDWVNRKDTVKKWKVWQILREQNDLKENRKVNKMVRFLT